MKENIIINKTFQFALDIIEYCETLNELRKYVVANQLLKSGTSIGANITEAQNAETKTILFTNLKSLQKKLKKQPIGYFFVNFQKNIRIATRLSKI